MDYAELMELARPPQIGKGLQRLSDLQRTCLRE